MDWTLLAVDRPLNPVASDNLKPRNVGEAAIPGSDIASDVQRSTGKTRGLRV